MFCSNCGNKVNETDKFCGNCGHQVNYFPSDHNPNNIDNNDNSIQYSNYDEYIPDQGIWRMFFTFKGRLNPKRYFIRTLVLNTLYGIIYGMIMLISTISFIPMDIVGMLTIVISMISGFSMLSLAVRRCHDIGRPGWYVVAMMFPPFLMGIEVMKDRWGWHDIWGDYHERWRINEGRMWIGLIISIIACMVMVIIFSFKSSQDGTNEYGPSPVGPMQDVPVQKNKVLAIISSIENNISSWYILGGFMIIFSFLGAVGSLSQENAHVESTYNKTSIVNPVEQQENNQSNQLEKPIPPQPPVPSVKTNDTKVKQEEKVNENNINIYSQAKSEEEKMAMMSLVSFHKNITNKDYHQAYDCFSNSFKNRVSYDGWAP